MPLENTTVDEVDKILNGNALDNEIAQFERGATSQPSSKEGTTETNKTEQPSDKEVTKTGEDKSTERSETKTAAQPVNIKDYDNLVGSNLANLKVTGDKKETEKKIDEDGEAEDKTKTIDPEVKLDEHGKPIRDLEGYGEQEKKWLQRMPYDSYKHFTSLIKEKKEIETKYKTESEALKTKITNLESGKQVLPESYYENPNAFILSPEFAKIQGAKQLSKVVEDHWTEQLRKFKKGESWTPLTNDPKTGEIVYDDDREFNADDEVYILKQLSGAEKQAAKYAIEVDRFVAGFQETHRSYISKVKQAEKEMLPVFENKESNEYKTYQSVIPTVEKWGIRKDNPAFDFVAKSVALNLIFKDALTSMIASQQKTKTLSEEQRKAGPTQSSFSGGGASNNNNKKEAPKFSDYEKLLRNDTF